MVALRPSEIDTGHGMQIGRYAQRRVLFEQGGTCDQTLPALTQYFHHQIAVLQRRKANA